MTVDLTNFLRGAVSRSSDWSSTRALALGQRIQQRLHGSQIDWDDEAGEEWIRILLGGRPVAIISTVFPVVFYRPDGATAVLAESSSPSLALLEAEDWDGARYTVSDATGVLPAGKAWSPEIDPSAFSINDLWWMTV